MARTWAGVISCWWAERPCSWIFEMTSDLEPRVVHPHLQVTSISTPRDYIKRAYHADHGDRRRPRGRVLPEGSAEKALHRRPVGRFGERQDVRLDQSRTGQGPARGAQAGGEGRDRPGAARAE